MINEVQYLKGYKNLGIGVSGGQDSLSLLHCMVSSDIKPSVVIHCNHGWRDDSEANAKFVESLCKDWELPFICYTWASPIKGEGPARQWRLDCFREATKTYNLKAVIVAHTATDNVETILYNIMRGTSPRGMKGICSVSSWKDLLLLRPLLNIWRDDTARYCADNGLTPWVDSTNEDIYYARNLIRQEVMPLLRMINSRADSHILQIKNLVSQDSLYLDAEAEDLLRSCRYAEESLDLRKLLDIHNSRTNPSAGSITRRIIRDFLEEITGASLSAKDIDRCYRFVLDKGSLTKSNHIRGGYQLIKEDGLLICKKI